MTRPVPLRRVGRTGEPPTESRWPRAGSALSLRRVGRTGSFYEWREDGVLSQSVSENSGQWASLRDMVMIMAMVTIASLVSMRLS